MKNTKLEEQLLIKLFLNLVQDIKVSLEYVDFYTKESFILDTREQLNNPTNITIRKDRCSWL